MYVASASPVHSHITFFILVIVLKCFKTTDKNKQTICSNIFTSSSYLIRYIHIDII